MQNRKLRSQRVLLQKSCIAIAIYAINSPHPHPNPTLITPSHSGLLWQSQGVLSLGHMLI